MRDGAPRNTRLRRCVQRNPYNFGNGSDNTFDPMMTPNGRFVVFTSRENLDDDPLDPAPDFDEFAATSDIFLHDFESGALQRVSIDAAGDLPRTADGEPAQASDPAISANGRLVAFATDGAFSPEDINSEGDVYLKNVRNGRLSLISIANAGTLPRLAFGGVSFGGEGGNVTLSGNGRFVAFITTAVLDPGRDRTTEDVYVKNLRTNRYFLASIDHRGVSSDRDDEFDRGVIPPISISANGRFVAFTTAAALVPVDDNRQADVYLWDRRRPIAAPLLVSFGSEPRREFFFDPLSSNPALSASGRFVAFESDAALLPEDTNGVRDIYRFDRSGRTLRRVSLDSEGRETAVAGSFEPAISASGRFVAFSSAAGDLVPHDLSFAADEFGVPKDIFVKDLRTGRITRASMDDDGIEPTGTSFSPSLSADARVIAFLTGDPNILEPAPGRIRPGFSVVRTGVDFAALPVDDVPGEPLGAASIERNFFVDADLGDVIADPMMPLDFSLRNTIGRPDDQDWFKVFLFARNRYEIDLEGRPTGQGTLDDPLLRIFRAGDAGEDPVLISVDDDGGDGLNARLAVQPLSDGTFFISAESFGAATGTYRLLVREQ